MTGLVASTPRGEGGRAGGAQAFSHGYSVGLMDDTELAHLRRDIDAVLDTRGVVPKSRVTYDWVTDNGEAGTLTSRMVYENARDKARAKQRPQSARAARDSRPEWMSGVGDRTRRPGSARPAKGNRPSSPFGMQRPGPSVPVPTYSRDAKRNIAVHAAKLHRPPTKMTAQTPAPSAGAFKPRKAKQTGFSRQYRCGDLPVSVNHSHSKPSIRWLVEPERLDLQYYLPLFFDGLREARATPRPRRCHHAHHAPRALLPTTPHSPHCVCARRRPVATLTRRRRCPCPALPCRCLPCGADALPGVHAGAAGRRDAH